jgi:hypothetical protein
MNAEDFNKGLWKVGDEMKLIGKDYVEKFLYMGSGIDIRQYQPTLL